MSIEAIKAKIPDYAKDIKLNLSSLLQGTEPVKLTKAQIAQLALAAAYATRQKTVIHLIESFFEEHSIENEVKNAVKAAASLMAMNNVYYRSIYSIEGETYSKLPANQELHMLQKHGIDQQDFELYCVVVSAINGCEYCLTSHIALLEKKGIGVAEIHYALRLASVIQGFAQVIAIEEAVR